MESLLIHPVIIIMTRGLAQSKNIATIILQIQTRTQGNEFLYMYNIIILWLSQVFVKLNI